MPGRIGRASLLATFLFLLGLFVPVPPASAHALLVASDPPSGASLLVSPRTVTLWFDERLDRGSVGRIVDERGRDVSDVRSTVGDDPTVLELRIPELAAGRYSALWQVRSADDGHRSDGALVFTVGLAVADQQSAIAADAAASPWEVALRWLALIGFAGVVGGLAMLCVVLPRPDGPDTPDDRQWQRANGSAGLRWAAAAVRVRLVTMVCASAVVASVAAVVDLATSAATDSSANSGWPSTVATLLTGSRGALWLLRSAALGTIIVAATRMWHRERDRNGPIPRGVDVLVGVSVVALALAAAVDGHPASVASSPTLAVAADAVHLLSAGVWIGGLAALLVVIASPKRRVLLRVCRLRFSMLMALSVAALVISGLVEAGRQIDRVPDLIDTGYGLLVLAKAGLLIGMLALALANVLALHEIGHHRAGGGGPRRRLVAAEATLGIVVLTLAGVLAGTSPPRGGPTGSTEWSPTTRTASADHLLVALTVTPNRPGYNGFSVSVATTRRPDPAPVIAVDLFVSGQMSALRDLGEGQYYTSGSLPDPGPASIRVIARRAAGDLVIDVPWTVGSAAARSPSEPQRTLATWTDALALVGLAVLAAAGVAVLLLTGRRRRTASADRPAARRSANRVPG